MATITENLNHAGKLIKSAFGVALSGIHAGDEKIAAKQVLPAHLTSINVTSGLFENMDFIPERFSPQGVNTSPALAWTDVPPDAKELVLVVEDPDAPMLSPFVHWIVHRLSPTSTGLPGGLPGERSLVQLGNAVQGMNDANTRGYYGPKPPVGHGVHHYHFQLFALDQAIGLGPDAKLEDLKKAMQGHVIGFGEIVGLFERTADTK